MIYMSGEKNEPTDENLLIAIRIKGIVDGFIKQVEDYSPAFVLNVLTTLVAGFLVSHEKFPSLNVNSFAKAVELTMKKVKEGLEENEKSP